MAHVNRTDSENRTALRTAAADGREGCVRVLLEAQAVVDEPSKNGRTALWVASAFGHEACVRALVEARAAAAEAVEKGLSAHEAADIAAELTTAVVERDVD